MESRHNELYVFHDGWHVPKRSEGRVFPASHALRSSWRATHRNRPRRGAILIVVLVCLAVAATVFVLVVKQADMERQVIRANQSSLQAIWLAEAGVERAAARLATDPAYSGETWSVSAKELAGEYGAVVTIHVEPVGDQPERRLVRVEADYPDVSEYRCRQVKQLVVDRDKIRSKEHTKTPQEGGGTL